MGDANAMRPVGGDLLTPLWRSPGRLPKMSLHQWELLLGQARQARLISRLAQHCIDLNAVNSVPEGAWRHLDGALRWVARQRHEVQWEVDCIQRALINVDSPIVLLKGAAYVIGELPAGRARLFSDIDIMVLPERLNEVEGALFGSGWISEERDAYNERYYRQWMHEIPPMKHVQRQTVIDVHHTITPPTSRFKVDGAKLFDRIVAVDEERRLFVLAPPDMVLHSAVHLFQEGEFSHGLRDLLDLRDLLAHFAQQADFWPGLFDRANELGLQIPLFHALFHIRRLFGVAEPAEWTERVNRLSPHAPARTAMAWLLGLALRPDHPSCNSRWTGLARWLLYVRSHALRMPFHLMVPHLVRKAWMLYFSKNKTATAVPDQTPH